MGEAPACAGRHREVLYRREATTRFFTEHGPDHDLPVVQRKLRAVLIDVADCRDTDRRAERLRRHTEFGRQLFARLDDQFRALKIGIRARGDDLVTQLRLHFLDHLVRRCHEQNGIVAAEENIDIAAAAPS